MARQANASVIFPSSLIQNVQTNAVNGRFTLPQALALLLDKTPLQGHISAAGMITIEPDFGLNRTAVKRLVPPQLPKPVQASEEKSAFSLETLLVTGSNIRGATLVGGNVLSISSEELAASNAFSIADYLQRHPLNLTAGVGTAEATLSGQDFGPDQANFSAGQGVNLRGVGALSTLVLVNGRRMASSGQYGDYVDISHIPLVVVDKIEILLDGASAIYGSDAVAGVVNIVTKKQLQRAQTHVSVGTATAGGGTEKQLSHAFSTFWNSGSLTLGAELYSRTAVGMTSRQYYANGSDFTAFGGNNWQALSLNANPVTTIFKYGVSGSNAEVGAVVPLGSNGDLSAEQLLPVNQGYTSDYNVYEGKDLLPDIERYGMYGQWEQDLSSQMLLRVQGMSNYRTSTYHLGYPIINSSVLLPSSPYYIGDLSPDLMRDDGGITFGKVETAAGETSISSVRHHSGSVGLYYDLADHWQLQGIASFARDQQRRIKYGLRDGNDEGILACSLGNTDIENCDDSILSYNPFSTQAMSDELMAQLYGYENLVFDSSVLQTSLKLDGTLLPQPHGELKVAFGVDFRQEKIKGELQTQMLSINSLSDTFNETKRNTLSVFGEAVVPLSQTIDIQLAARFEDFAGTGNYNTFDPKLGVDWRFAKQWTLQGAWGTSFHAPALRYEDDSPQLTPGGNAAYTLNQSRFGPCDSELVAFNGLIGSPGATDQQCSMTVLVISGGAGPDKLKPEESQNWSIGLHYRSDAFPGFNASVSYFNIQVDNRIQRIQSGTFNQILAAFFATGDTYDSALIVDPSVEAVQTIMDSAKYLGTYGQGGIADSAEDVAMIVDATQRNIGALREQGIDFDFAYEGTSWEAFFSGSYFIEYATKASSGKPYVNYRNRYLSSGAPVAFRSKQGLRWHFDNVSARLVSHYVSSYKCTVCYITDDTGAIVESSQAIDIDDWLTWDLGVQWQLAWETRAATVNLWVQNLFDTEAPFVDAGTGIDDAIPEAYDFSNHNSLGRSLSLSFNVEW
nr:TonB-dependent receptor [Alteromonas sp. C1M14]